MKNEKQIRITKIIKSLNDRKDDLKIRMEQSPVEHRDTFVRAIMDTHKNILELLREK